MDDPTVPMRLEEAITMIGTCKDMCPEFERFRRERENNLDRWECVRCLLSPFLGVVYAELSRQDRWSGRETYEEGVSQACCENL